MDDQIERRVRESFAKQTMMQTLGAEIIDVQPGLVRVTAPVLPGAMQQQGFGHAGLTFSIGDSAAGYAALSMLPPEVDVVTSEIKINLLAPARGDRLIAAGRVVKPGRRLCVVTAEVYAETDGAAKLIAILQGTIVPVPAA
ncbi:PaaI family thioesterase [Sulfitobacter dubius]|uniref:PaaI family thioesterase n=1 Tax=Sulfitobacter dubius TaxID=218673 RepID=UPI0022AEC7F8|nr:PaaI family thioesterase [Sulfitobacter dubius]MCZ4367770.1 PaaI family thioesterase [Sulfitobacter dubius]